MTNATKWNEDGWLQGKGCYRSRSGSVLHVDVFVRVDHMQKVGVVLLTTEAVCCFAVTIMCFDLDVYVLKRLVVVVCRLLYWMGRSRLR